MKKKRILEISCCQQCPKYIAHMNCCIEMDSATPIPDKHKIPKFCQLETVEEFCESHFVLDT